VPVLSCKLCDTKPDTQNYYDENINGKMKVDKIVIMRNVVSGQELLKKY
jgi:hypothetical protein